MIVTPPGGPASPSYRKLLVAASIGSAFEVYDFTLFAFFAVSIAPSFFPSTDPAVSLLATVATFGIGAFMRPLGAVVLGIYGDRVGRKAVLSLTFIMMALGSTVIGLTPGFSTIGIWAPVIVVIARLAQGFSAGAELGSASAFVAEQVPGYRRGYYLGYISTACMGATVISAAIGLGLNAMLGKQIMGEWGWRIPFLFGAIVAPVGIYIRRRLPESHLYSEKKHELEAELGAPPRPRVGALKLLAIMCGFIPGTALNYLTLIYMPSYLNSQFGVSLDTGFRASLVAAALVAVLMPVFGLLSDVIGRKIPFVLGNIVAMFVAYPLYLWLSHSSDLATFIIIQCSFSVFTALATAPMVPLAAEMFPTIGRSTGMSLGTAIPLALFGTCAPLTVTWLMMTTGHVLAPAFYIMAATGIGALVIALLPAPRLGGPL